MSRRHLCALIAGLALVVATSWADEKPAAPSTSEASQITLRPEAFVKGPKVRLGEIAEVRGDKAEELAAIEIAPCALPGASRRIDAALVETRVRDSGFKDLSIDAKSPRAVNATTLHLEISRDAIAEDLRRFISVNMPWDPAETTVDVMAPAYDVTLPDGDVTFDWKSNPQYKYIGAAGFRGEISVNGELKKTVMCRVTIDTYQDVVVAQESIRAGDIITPDIVSVEKRPLSKLEGGTYTSVDDVAGKTARSTIFQGALVTKQRVVPPKVVLRNQVVQVEAHYGAVVGHTQAKALSDGAVGDTITVYNAQSKQKFTGAVRHDGVIVVN
jgi:flagella basal body P-ring formation protein FlgA